MTDPTNSSAGEKGTVVCARCSGGRWVCEAHPDRPGPCGTASASACHCGDACMPCPDCNHPSTWGHDGRPTLPPGFVLDQMERNN